MNGIIVIDKPKDYTSRDIVNIVSKKFKTKKVGHTGTLDPLATGVLVVCIGSSTKLVEVLTSTYKEYIAEATLGIETDTLDSEGSIINHKDVSVTEDKIRDVLLSFIGSYEQEVPLYSAIRVDGKKLYEYAREGIEVSLPKREVEIKEIELLSLNLEENKFSFRVVVSKGTYIRSLVSDIAKKLNTVGIMSDLRRTRQGVFTLEDITTLEDLENDKYKIISIQEALSDIYSVDMDEKLYKKISNGAKISNIYNEDMVLFKYKNKAVALYRNDNDILRIYKMFN